MMRLTRHLAAAACLALAALSASRATAEEAATAPVLRRAVYPGETVPAGALVDVDLRRLAIAEPIVRDRSELAGKVARIVLRPGQPIPLRALMLPPVVKAGAPILLVYEQGGLRITARAVSLEDGAEGAVIRVRSPDGGKLLPARVQADGTATVAAP